VQYDGAPPESEEEHPGDRRRNPSPEGPEGEASTKNSIGSTCKEGKQQVRDPRLKALGGAAPPKPISASPLKAKLGQTKDPFHHRARD